MYGFLEKLYEYLESLSKRILKYPPGPYGLPIVGYLPFLTDRPFLRLTELSEKYGDIFSINIGYRRWIILNSADAIREHLLKPEFLGRPHYGLFTLMKKYSPFFTYLPVDEWEEIRKSVMHSLKLLGMGSSKMDEQVKEEICSFIKALELQAGKPIDVKPLLSLSMANNVSLLLFGERYDYKHPEANELHECLLAASKYISQTALLQLFPWMRFIPFFKGSGFKNCVEAYNGIANITRKKIEDHKKTIEPENIRDFIDIYLAEEDSGRKKNIKTYLNENVLVDTTTDLFSSGSETIFATVSWCIYLAAAYPDIQERVKEEIAEVIGYDRMVDFSDRKSMPYTYATILEVQRFKSTIPLNGLRYTEVDATIGDYFIPANTVVVANFWAMHHDPRNWEDPDRFKPERFLSDDGKSVIIPPYFLPFSTGKRNCPGEAMANMEIFLYFVSMLQAFDIKFPDGYKPTFNTHFAASLKPGEFKVVLSSRNRD